MVTANGYQKVGRSAVNLLNNSCGLMQVRVYNSHVTSEKLFESITVSGKLNIKKKTMIH